MLQETFSVTIRTPGATKPVLAVRSRDGSVALAERMRRRDGPMCGGRDLDVTYRLTPGSYSGVLAVSDRLTGDFLLKTTVDSACIEELVAAIPKDGEDGQYHLRITTGERATIAADKSTLLVYDGDGSLRRDWSLIPAGVEL